MNKSDTETSQTKLALIQQSLTTMNGSITEIKSDLKEIKNSFLPISVYNDFKIDYEKKLIETQVSIDKSATKEDMDTIKKILMFIGGLAITAIAASFFKIILH